jgi:nicotinamide mononucleotide transporter
MSFLDTAKSFIAPWLAPWLTIWGVPVSQLEALAFVLGLVMVWGNFKVKVWAWPLAFISSLLYGLLFFDAKLYGEAGLQVMFMVMAVWGAWQWLYGRTSKTDTLPVRALSHQGRWLAVLATAALWPALGWLLDHVTDSDVPYLDALPTAGSVVGQYLLGRKWLDNWACWFAVNVVSIGLFAYKELWLTVVLYGLFAVLSLWGWQQWRKLATPCSAAN